MADEITIELVLDSAGVTKGLKKVEGKGKETGGNIGSGLASGIKAKAALIGAAVAAGLAGAVVMAAAKKLKDAVVEVTSAAITQDNAVKKLNNSLITTGQYSKAASVELQKFASGLQSVTTFGDEAILSQLGFAQSMGATIEQSKMIVKAGADMAKALEIDLNSAVRNIAKTLGGYAGELGEVIPELKKLTQAQMQAGAGAELIAKKFKGFAELQAFSLGGAITQLTAAWGDLIQKMGLSVTESTQFILMIQTATKAIAKFAEKADFSFLIDGMIAFSKATLLAVEGTLGLTAFLSKLMIGEKNPITQFFMEATLRADNFRISIEKITKAIADKRAAENEDAKQKMSNDIATMKSKLEIAAQEAKMTELRGAQAAYEASLLAKQEDNVKAYAATVKTAMMMGVVASFSAFGKALTSSGNGLKDFGKTLLSSLGGIAIQIGTFFMLASVGMGALAKIIPAWGLSAGEAFTAGMGLTVLGGMLQGMAGGGGVSASTSAVSGGGGEATATSTLTTDTGISDLNEQASLKEQQNVQLVVHGDILDSDETGTRLLQILNDNFESSGGRLLTV